jgi:choline dehydrogenase-like flavoprotein
MTIINRGSWDSDPLSDAYLSACSQAGIPENKDYNGHKFEGAGYLQQSIRNGRRCSVNGLSQAGSQAAQPDCRNRRNCPARLV